MEQFDELIGTEEAAALLGTDRKIVIQLAESGRLKGYRDKGTRGRWRLRLVKPEVEAMAATEWRRRPRKGATEE